MDNDREHMREFCDIAMNQYARITKELSYIRESFLNNKVEHYPMIVQDIHDDIYYSVDKLDAIIDNLKENTKNIKKYVNETENFMEGIEGLMQNYIYELKRIDNKTEQLMKNHSAFHKLEKTWYTNEFYMNRLGYGQN